MSLFLLLTRPHTATPTPTPTPGSEVSDLEIAIVTALEGSSAVSALVGTNVFPSAIPEHDQLPAITYELISFLEGFTLQGADGMATSRVRFASRSADKTQAAAIVGAIRGLMLPVRGDFHGVRVEFVRTAGVGHSYVNSDDGTDDGIHRRSIDLMFKFRTTRPG